VPTKRTVTVTILGHGYRIRTEAEPERVRRAAALLDETLERVRAQAGTVDTVDLAVLAALNLANSLVTLRDGSRGDGWRAVEGRLDQLIALVESVGVDSAATVS
jgi:cell division protein ZapA